MATKYIPETNVHITVKVENIEVQDTNRFSNDEIIKIFNAAFTLIKEKLGVYVQYSLMNDKFITERSIEVLENNQYNVGCSFYWEKEYELDDTISNTQNNATRFIIVTNKKICSKDASKVSICFEIAHESGSLYHMLSHFIYNNINMTNIQSRPIKGKNWEYRFFVDFEGRLEDTGVINALRGIKEEATSMKILGTY